MDQFEENPWLDAETKAVLCKSPPNPLAPPMLDTFAILMLSRVDTDNGRHIRAIERAAKPDLGHRDFLELDRQPPFVLFRSLDLADAMFAQFELASCDLMSLFLSDDVLTHAEPQYMADLANAVTGSPEFQKISIRVFSIPDSDAGARFADQFLGVPLTEVPLQQSVFRKKARIMVHWAKKIGAVVEAEL